MVRIQPRPEGVPLTDVHQFAYGWVTPALAYGVSVLGSLLGLVCTSRARRGSTPAGRAGWLALAALSIGGTGIWLMHFLAMIGFTVDGTPIRYDIEETTLSAVIGIAVVGVGLTILGTGRRPRFYRVVLGGVFAGLGVAGMHYTGMAAMRVEGTVSYDSKLVVTSIVIAVVAASVAFWFTIVANSFWLVTGAALIMGVAVNGMHYVAMYAVNVTLDQHHSADEGVDVATALPIIAGLAGIVVVVLLYAALSIPTDEEIVPMRSPVAHAPEPSLWAPRTVPGPRATQEPTTPPRMGTVAPQTTSSAGAHRAPADAHRRAPGDPW